MIREGSSEFRGFRALGRGMICLAGCDEVEIPGVFLIFTEDDLGLPL